MGLRPGALAGIALAVPQQERLHLLARLLATAPDVFPRASEIADRFVLGLGHVDGRELAGAVEPRERFGVAPIGLDAIPRAAGNLRRADDGAGESLLAQETIDLEAAGAGLVDEPAAPSAAAGARASRPPRGRRRSRRSADLPVAPSSARETSIDSLWTSSPT
jgi:hypothetical protein